MVVVILSKLRMEVPKSSMRSSNLGMGGDILGKLKTKVPKSSMRSSNCGIEYSWLAQN